MSTPETSVRKSVTVRVPGEKLREGIASSGGWPGILDRYGAAADADAPGAS